MTSPSPTVDSPYSTLPGILHSRVPLSAGGECEAGLWWAWAPLCRENPKLCTLPGGGSSTLSMAEHPMAAPGVGTPYPIQAHQYDHLPSAASPGYHPGGMYPPGWGWLGQGGVGPRAVFWRAAPMLTPSHSHTPHPLTVLVGMAQLRLGALVWLCTLLGRSQGHCRVTQRAQPTRLFPAAEIWHTRCRPAGSQGCTHQPLRQTPEMLLHGRCQPCRLSPSLVGLGHT